MNDTQQKQLGSTLWAIADKLRGAMNADDFRDYMLSFLFLRYLPVRYPTVPKNEARIRFSLNAAIPEEDYDCLMEFIEISL